MTSENESLNKCSWFLLKSLERCNHMVKSFVEGCANESETHVFYSSMSRCPLNTFEDTSKASKCKYWLFDFVKANIKSVKIARRALFLDYVREDETVVRILAYPIGPIPSALFHDDGTKWKCYKCDIIHLLEEDICSSFNLTSYDYIYQRYQAYNLIRQTRVSSSLVSSVTLRSK